MEFGCVIDGLIRYPTAGLDDSIEEFSVEDTDAMDCSVLTLAPGGEGAVNPGRIARRPSVVSSLGYDVDVQREAVRGYAIPRKDEPTGRELMAEQTKLLAAILEKRDSGRKRSHSEGDMEEWERNPESFAMVSVDNHSIKDDAVSAGDWTARKLRPWSGSQEEMWRNLPRVARPVLNSIVDEHLHDGEVNPRLLVRMHDRGSELSIKQFFGKNANVTSRQAKVRLDGDSTASWNLDFVEPQGVWEVIDCVHHYVTALWCVRREDHTGLVLLRVLHDFRYFAGAARNDKHQVEMLKSFVDAVLVKNGSNGRKSAPPVGYEGMMRMADRVLFKAGHRGVTSQIGVEPYVGRKVQSPQDSQPQQPRGAQPRGRGQGGSGGRAGGQGGSGAGGAGGAAARWGGASRQDKVGRCCPVYNRGASCSGGCGKDHLCSRVMANGMVCWKSDHNETTHK